MDAKHGRLRLTTPIAVALCAAAAVSAILVARTADDSSPRALAGSGPTPTRTATPTPIMTPTPCVLAGCPPPTPLSTVSIVLQPRGSSMACDDVDRPTRCTTGSGAFTLSMSPRAVPTEGFTEFRTTIIYDGLVYKPATSPGDEILWPDRSHINVRLPEMPHGHEGWVHHTDLSPGLGSIPSYYQGSLVDLTINCPVDDRWYLLRHDPYVDTFNPTGSTLLVGTADTYIPVSGEVYIHCDPALAGGVGGLARAPDVIDQHDGASNSGWLIAGVAMAVLAALVLGAALFRARRT